MSASRLALLVLALVALPVVASAQEPSSAPAYVGSDKCKSCHGPIHAAWERTKHASAIERLKVSERNEACIGCHVTGSPEQIAREKGRPSHPNVQCESCHGPASLHVANPQVTTGIVKTPPASNCETCHNERSPHYRGFVYAGMVYFVHKVKE